MILKIAGGIFVILSCWGIGVYQYSREALHVKELTEFLRALELLEREVSYNLTPLPEAFSTISSKIKPPFAPIFEQIAITLKEKSGKPFLSIWQEIWISEWSVTHMGEEEKELILSAGTSLGYLDTQMQTSSITFLRNELATQRTSLQTLLTSKKKLYQTLGLMGGCLLVIILI